MTELTEPSPVKPPHGPPSGHLRVARKIWLADGATPVFGAGILELLALVEATGSLHRAASDMGIAYSKAWRIVRRAEEHLGFTLLTRHAGGPGGGGSALSAEARWLVRAFGDLLREADPLLDELCARHLGGWLDAQKPDGRAGAPTRARP
jgi:molybdate transport system regulatory protein